MIRIWMAAGLLLWVTRLQMRIHRWVVGMSEAQVKELEEVTKQLN